MNITFSPSRDDHSATFERYGDVVLVDGEPFDFALLPEGGILPAEAIGSDWICSDVTRMDGVLHLALKLGHGVDAPDAVRYPDAVTLTGDGPIALPGHTSKPSEPKANT